MQRKKKFLLNTVTSMTLQLTTVFCGLILPKLFIETFGSEVNGFISSISRFLSVIVLMEAGVGAVIQSNLYKPIADNDLDQISRIVTSGKKFYQRIACILLIYVLFLTAFFLFITGENFSWLYSSVLIISISISTFGQYLFGIMDQTFLNAAQFGYISSIIRIFVLILNLVISIVLMKSGASVHLVKLASSIVFLVQPFATRIAVNRKYKINRRMKYEGEPIKQKWNGFAQHLSYVVLEDTDTIVLTFFSTLSNVSIYSVYNGVIYGVKQLIQAVTKGTQSLMGDMIAREEKEKLADFYGAFEYAVHMMTVFAFSCIGILIIPFVEVYTVGINDANYIQPIFATLLTVANAMHTIRIPFNVAIMAGGHYKQTQPCYVVAALINVFVSIIAVFFWGLVGVAVGTMAAMFYQTVWMAVYISKNIILWPIKEFIKKVAADMFVVMIISFVCVPFSMGEVTFISWIFLAAKVAVVALAVISVISVCFFRKEIKYFLKIIKP